MLNEKEAGVCPKCGSGDVGLIYCKGNYSCSHYPPLETIEHMVHHCERCHYEWYSKPLDSEADDAE